MRNRALRVRAHVIAPRPTSPLARTGSDVQEIHLALLSLRSVAPRHRPAGLGRRRRGRAGGRRRGAADRSPADPRRADHRARPRRQPDRPGADGFPGLRRRGPDRAASAGAPRRGAGDGARPDRDAAQRRGQGQPVLPARLQPRPRHRLRDVGGRRAGQPAEPRPRPGLHRPELHDPRADRARRLPQGRLLRRPRRLLVRRRRRHRLLRRAAEQHRAGRGRHVRLRARPARRRRTSSGPGHLLYAARALPQRRALGTRGRLLEGQRRAPLQPRRRELRRHRHRVRLRRRLGRHRSDREACAPPVRWLRPLQLARQDDGRRLPEVHALRRVAPAQREQRQPGAGLRLLPEPRSVLELHLLPVQPAGRPVRADGRALGRRRQGCITPSSARCSNARWRTTSDSRSAATASRTACSRR